MNAVDSFDCWYKLPAALTAITSCQQMKPVGNSFDSWKQLSTALIAIDNFYSCQSFRGWNQLSTHLTAETSCGQLKKLLKASSQLLHYCPSVKTYSFSWSRCYFIKSKRMLLRLDWCDSGVWRYMSCLCCWCRHKTKTVSFQELIESKEVSYCSAVKAVECGQLCHSCTTDLSKSKVLSVRVVTWTGDVVVCCLTTKISWSLTKSLKLVDLVKAFNKVYRLNDALGVGRRSSKIPN